MTFKKTITLSMMLAGATAMVSQIVFLREFLIVFYGNEISIGIILASWLIWGAFGSWFLGRFSDSLKGKVRAFSLCQLGLFFILPVTLLAIRVSKPFLGITTGEIVGYLPMALTSFAVLSVSCSVMGFMFALACRIYKSPSSIPAEQVARVYILEAVGALTGGLLVSYFLAQHAKPFSIIFLMAFLNILGSMLVQRHGEASGSKRFFFPATVIVLVLGVTWASLGGMTQLREYSLSRLWKGYHVLGSRDSVYGNIAVTERGDQRSFFDNGLHLYTVPDRLSSEESVHFALLGHKEPKDVLLIGGGVGGMIEEILKHPVKKIDYVELDPVIIAMAKKYLGKEDSGFLDRPEVNVINEDGRFYVKRTRDSYDCVIIHLGDPYTAQINRFYTVEFFRELRGILNNGGVVSFGLTSSENYIGEELGDYLASIYESVSAVFPEVLIVPGDTVFFLASNRKGAITADTGVLVDRIKKRGLDVRYVREYYLFSKLSRERVEYAKEAITENRRVSKNRDFKPVSYYYATVFWGTHFDVPIFQKFTRSVTAGSIWGLAAFFCLLILALGFVSRRRRGKRAVLIAVMTTGFAEINFQIAVVLSFQAIYGYVFYKLGIIITSFMVGLALGGWIIARYMPRIKDDMTVFLRTQVSICLYPLILPVFFLWLSGTRSDAVSWMGSNVIYPFLPVITGIIGGVQFPLANKIYLEEKEELGRVAGLTYGLDLVGACIGALLAAAFLVPVIGIFQTCFLVAMINAVVLVVLLIGRRSV